MQNLSFNWEKLQNVFYRSKTLTELKWSTGTMVGNFAISISFIAIQGNESIEIYNYLGELLGSLKLSLFHDIVKLEFDELTNNLIVVCSKSIKIVKNWSPLEIVTVQVSDEMTERIWDYKRRIVIFKGSQDVFQLNSQDKLEMLVANNEKFTILTKEHWHCNNEKVIILDTDHVFQIDLITTQISKLIKKSEWHRVSISSDGFIALYNAKFNKLQVFKEPERILLEHKIDGNPISIKWCGNDTIVCAFDDEIKLYGPQGSFVTFWYPDSIFSIRTEIDGLKIFTKKQILFVSRVQACTSNIFRIGSTEPGAMLLDSWNLLADHAPRAIENLKNFNLAKGVMDCIEASMEEFDPQLQKLLLNAASFGKSSLPHSTFNSETFVNACELLKLLNILHDLGIFITKRQYDVMGLNEVIEWLLISHKYYESIEICKLLNQKALYPKVFEHWASTKIKLSNDLEDNELLSAIQNQLRELPVNIRAPMSEVAESALSEGYFSLARSLALLDSDSEAKIITLIKLDDNSLALKESLKTESPEFVLSLLLELKKKLTASQLSKLLIMDMSEDQLYAYFQRHDHEFCFDFYRQSDRYVDLAYCLIEQGKGQNSLDSFLPQIKSLYSNVVNDPISKDKCNLIERVESLNKYQENLSGIFKIDFHGLTLDQTLSKLIGMQQEKYVKTLIKMFKINEKKYYFTAYKTFVELKKFEEVYQFATNKKSPIGLLPLYKKLRSKGYKKEAARYVSLIPDLSYEDRKKMLLDCDGYQQLITLSIKEKDVAGLKELYKAIPPNEPQLKNMITEAMNKL
ncbi:hypothetical protein KAFR_0H01440 [Kazachstania africana CBS 2517]|uniref:Probable vacuolar protein sorting-associated protein 16 homolog n=1 Tax=Kazachstania africana (strain ATCC 22294 / BCRC 22015 / CBS 2517 / CECT 1963 / NBRC 1671 / NRRL Y-8276) TaxID=1071382 RepID=H2AYZ8_KAZAF|nr:hypothetical protein KAFR_0H01440 [Kazachstania africana CBS 2517]CCF59554.1 hypothetical protein KAFR_0H01440 [Kazachstania africana CBS 2517]